MKNKTFTIATLGCWTNQYEVVTASVNQKSLYEIKKIIKNCHLASNKIEDLFIQGNDEDHFIGVVL